LIPGTPDFEEGKDRRRICQEPLTPERLPRRDPTLKSERRKPARRQLLNEVPVTTKPARFSTRQVVKVDPAGRVAEQRRHRALGRDDAKPLPGGLAGSAVGDTGAIGDSVNGLSAPRVWLRIRSSEKPELCGCYEIVWRPFPRRGLPVSLPAQSPRKRIGLR